MRLSTLFIAAAALVGTVAGAQAETDRLGLRKAPLSARSRAERKLGNQGFVAKAPPEVVQAEREKLERLRAELEAL